MNSEKVKEILGKLHCKLLGDRRNEINHEEINCVGEVITLINELESENERLENKNYQLEQDLGQCENGYKLELHTARYQLHSVNEDLKKAEKRIAELGNIGLNENITVAEYLREMQRLKDRVAELEKENVCEHCQRVILGKEVYCLDCLNKFREISLKQFAERLKEEGFVIFMGDIIIRGSKVDEVLKEFINEIT